MITFLEKRQWDSCDKAQSFDNKFMLQCFKIKSATCKAIHHRIELKMEKAGLTNFNGGVLKPHFYTRMDLI